MQAAKSKEEIARDLILELKTLRLEKQEWYVERQELMARVAELRTSKLKYKEGYQKERQDNKYLKTLAQVHELEDAERYQPPNLNDPQVSKLQQRVHQQSIRLSRYRSVLLELLEDQPYSSSHAKPKPRSGKKKKVTTTSSSPKKEGISRKVKKNGAAAAGGAGAALSSSPPPSSSTSSRKKKMIQKKKELSSSSLSCPPTRIAAKRKQHETAIISSVHRRRTRESQEEKEEDENILEAGDLKSIRLTIKRLLLDDDDDEEEEAVVEIAQPFIALMSSSSPSSPIPHSSSSSPGSRQRHSSPSALDRLKRRAVMQGENPFLPSSIMYQHQDARDGGEGAVPPSSSAAAYMARIQNDIETVRGSLKVMKENLSSRNDDDDGFAGGATSPENSFKRLVSGWL